MKPFILFSIAVLLAAHGAAQPKPGEEAEGRRPAIVDVTANIPEEIVKLLGGRAYEVGSEDGAVVDASRNKRKIAYRWRYPKGFSGPAPLIIVSHGGFGSEVGYTAYPHLASTYAKFGFITITINHLPSANEDQHRFDRPTDVTFVINSIVRGMWPNQRDPDVLAPPQGFGGKIDVQRIGLTGHSFGAYTSHLIGGAIVAPTLGASNFRDARVRAIAPISPQGSNRFGFWDDGAGSNSWSGITLPVYLLCGEKEGPEWRRQPFDRYPAGDKYLTVGKGQTHAGMGNSGTEQVKRLIALNTALFFDTYLREGKNRCRIGTLAWIDGWTLERKLAGPGECRP
jgi:dienelactone hydrolase